MTKKTYLTEPYKKEFTAKVVDSYENKIVLDQTCFYPQGGGQVGDTGTINDIQVLATVKDNIEYKEVDGKQIPSKAVIVHELESNPFKVGDKVTCKIDWEKRYATMKLHAASHISYHFIMKKFPDMGCAGTLVDHKKDRSTYISDEAFTPEFLEAIEQQTNDFIQKNLEIKRYPSEDDSNIWIWECGDIIMPCGGTHPLNTEEIGKVTLKRKNKGKGKEGVEIYLA